MLTHPDLAEGADAAPRRSSTGLLQRVAAWVIVGIVLVTFVIVGYGGISATVNEQKSPTVATWTVFIQQQECVRNAIERQIPKGARIVIYDSNTYNAQRLQELATGWAVPVNSPASASYQISLTAGTACEGEALWVRPFS
jgi:hypothetical protein